MMAAVGCSKAIGEFTPRNIPTSSRRLSQRQTPARLMVLWWIPLPLGCSRLGDKKGRWSQGSAAPTASHRRAPRRLHVPTLHRAEPAAHRALPTRHVPPES